VVETVTEALRSSEARGRPVAVNVRVGVLSCTSPEALRAAYGLAAEGTALAGSRLEVEEVLPGLRCVDCGWVSEGPAEAPACGGCGSTRLAPSGGMDLEVVSVEVDDGAPGE
jgi:hydrogenase nickel incorporation protein HypA/HybF